MKKPLQYKFNIFLFLLPALFLFIAVLIAPIIMSFYYSLTEWNGFTTPEFIGVKNYIELFTSRSINIPRALKNAFLLALLSCVIQLPFALWLALRLARPIKGKTALLSIYFMPVLISTVVIGQLWLKIYNPDYGILNVLLRSLGLDKWTQVWLGDKKTALGAAFVPILWQYVGYHMLLMYAGIKGVPVELTEAAMLDGQSLRRHPLYPPHPARQRHLRDHGLPEILRPDLRADKRRTESCNRGAEHSDDQHAFPAKPLRHGLCHRRHADYPVLLLRSADQYAVQGGEVR